MTDPKATDTTPDNFSDLAMQPTGSGVADLEIAYEQMRLAEDADAADTLSDAGAADEMSTYDATMTPTQAGEDAGESVGHPS